MFPYAGPVCAASSCDPSTGIRLAVQVRGETIPRGADKDSCLLTAPFGCVGGGELLWVMWSASPRGRRKTRFLNQGQEVY